MSRFIDETKIILTSGNGGAGCVAFHREKYVPKGGPAGGDGGKGGDIWIATNPNLATLLDLRYKKNYQAENGKPGQGGNKAGSDGHDITIYVPVGTIVKNAQTEEVIADLTSDQDKILLCKGGRGGKGNSHFATSTHQAPRFAQPGEPGETRELKLELKLLADVGLLGYPNAGKSTLISKISAARPKIADYAFTTLVPNLGVVRTSPEPGSPTFVVADVPGLIEGASLGRGLGTKFLKHLDRTVLLVHLIDGAKMLKEFGAESPKKVAEGCLRDKEILDTELYTFSEELSKKPQIFAFNKSELFQPEFLDNLKTELEKIGIKNPFFISGAAHIGLTGLLEAISTMLFGESGLKNQLTFQKKRLPDEINTRE